MNEFSAIMGLCNLNHLEEAIEQRKEIFDRYVSFLNSVKGIRLFRIVKENELNNQSQIFYHNPFLLLLDIHLFP